MAIVTNNDIAKAIFLSSKGKSKEDFPVFSKRIVQFLDKKRLLSKAPDILNKLENIINMSEGRVVTKVWSARELNHKTKQELKSFLEKYYKAKEVVLIEKLNEKLIGGFRLEINNEIIDLTVKNEIKKLQDHLTKKYE